MNYKNNLNNLASKLEEFILSEAEGVEIPTEDFGWYNKRFVADEFRISHIERYSDKNLEVIYGDVTDFDSVRHAIKNCSYVFNLAASVSVPYSFQNPQTFIDTNILGALNIFRASVLNKKKIKKIIQISSSEVYGNNLIKNKNILTEETITVSESPYAASKIASDNLAISMQKATGLPIVIARPFNTFGPRQSLRAVIPTLITQFILLNKKNNLIKVGNLDTSRDFVRQFVNSFKEYGKNLWLIFPDNKELQIARKKFGDNNLLGTR